jgi:hypothetical protein
MRDLCDEAANHFDLKVSLNRGAKPKTMHTTPRLHIVLGGVAILICTATFGLALSSCSTNVSSQQRGDKKLEVAVCKLISTPQATFTGTGTFIALSVKGSLLSALTRTDNSSLQRVAKDLIAAAKTETRTGSVTPIMIALGRGVMACHRLGLRTGTD